MSITVDGIELEKAAGINLAKVCFLDIETLGIEASSVITEIGLVSINASGAVRTLYEVHLDIVEQQNRSVEMSAIRFRIEQAAGNPQLLYRMLGNIPLSLALEDLKAIMAEYDKVVVWGSMDEFMVQHAYRQYKNDFDPNSCYVAHYRKWINARAFAYLFPDAFIKPKNTVHSAVEDASWLAKCFWQML